MTGQRQSLQPVIKMVHPHTEEIKESLGHVPSFLEAFPPEVQEQTWTTMRDLQLAETVIPNKYKELIGLAVSAATRCRYCTYFHTEAAKLHGATEAEIAEANAMAAWTMMASTFINGQQAEYDRFVKETQDVISYVKANAAEA